jgi:nucleotide-binding universal stress UspA family protein
MEFTGSIDRVLAGVKNPFTQDSFYHFVLSTAELTGAKTVHFLHVVDDLTKLSGIAEPGHSLFETFLENFEKQVRTIASQFPSIEVHCEVREGEVDELMLHWVRVQNINLLVLGRHSGKLKSGSRSIKATRMAPCHVLLVPEQAEWKPITSVLLPVDFSDYSELGLKAVARIHSLKEITCLNIYQVPTGYYYSGANESEAEARMLKNAKEAWDRFKKILPESAPPAVPAFVLKKSSLADDIQAYTQTKSFDLVVIGSKGLTGSVGFMLGSVSQEFIREFNSLPVLIIKKRAERLSLIEALIS